MFPVAHGMGTLVIEDWEGLLRICEDTTGADVIRVRVGADVGRREVACPVGTWKLVGVGEDGETVSAVVVVGESERVGVRF